MKRGSLLSISSTIVRNGLVLLPGSEPSAVDLLLENGKFAAILERGQKIAGGHDVIDASGLHVFPGLIDPHVHFGFGEPVTEYTTETIYAAQGGYSTIIAFLLKNESYMKTFTEERDECSRRSFVDFAFHFCTAGETHLEELAQYVGDCGVTSFKFVMNFKADEGRYLGLDGTDDGYLLDLLTAAAEMDLMMVIHPENIEIVNRIRRRVQLAGLDTLKDYCLSKPAVTEVENMIRAMYLAEFTGARIYFPHVSSKEALREARLWRGRYGNISLETCPHYLTHTEDSDLGSVGRANPPFRTVEDNDALWQGIEDGTIDTVGSDHVPRKLATKQKGIWQASQGFPGTATILPVLLSEGFHKGRLSLKRIAEVCSTNPARIFGLERTKGSIRVGADADLTFVDLEKTRVVKASELGSYSDYSLYDGWNLKGWPVRTVVRGTTVMLNGEIVGPPGTGDYLPRVAERWSPERSGVFDADMKITTA
jgi:dihydropyrimidinase